MTSKSFNKVLITVKSGIMVVRKFVLLLIFNFQWNKCYRAYRKLVQHNQTALLGACKCVSDAGGIPIFTYNSQTCNFEYLAIPVGYVLLKIINSSDEITYAFAKSASKRSLFPRHTVLCYFVDVYEWDKQFE